MDRESVLEQFSQIEKKIEDLIATRKRLEAANNELTQQNQKLTAQLQEKISNERQHDELKGLIKSKIEGLMGKLDGIAGE